MPVVPRCAEVESVSDRTESPRPLPAKAMSNRMILSLAKSGWLPLGKTKAPEPKKSPPTPAPVPRNAGESGTPGRRGLQRAGWIPKDKPAAKPSVESCRPSVDKRRDMEKRLALFRQVREQRLAKEAAAKKNPPAKSTPAPAPAPSAAVSAPISAPIPVEWSFAEDYTIKHMQEDGKAWEEMSDKLGHPVQAIRRRYFELRMRDMKTRPTIETIRARDAEIKAAREQATTPPISRPTSSSSRPSTATSSGSALSSPTTAPSSRTSFDTPRPARPGFIRAQRRTKPKPASTPAAAPAPAAAPRAPTMALSRAAAPPRATAPPPAAATPPHRHLPPRAASPQKPTLRPSQPPTPPTTPATPSRRVKFSVLSKASPAILASLTRAINTTKRGPSSGLSGLNPHPDETEACMQFYQVHGHAPPAYRGLFKVDGEEWTQLACWVLETLQARWCEGGGALVGSLRAFSGQVFDGEEVRGKIKEVGVVVGL